jgi:DMSO/TMAO reductase YedYZ molybdopterin-dependent catalytic subunit
MHSPVLLQIDGEVTGQRALTWEDLIAIDSRWQIPNVSQLDPKKSGSAVWMRGILEVAKVCPEVQYMTLHSMRDDFHASLPLDAVVDRGMFIYQHAENPLPVAAGGPIRFFIPNFSACHSAEVDECANVKFVERIEFSQEKGLDNRPLDDASHEALHQQEDD